MLNKYIYIYIICLRIELYILTRCFAKPIQYQSTINMADSFDTIKFVVSVILALLILLGTSVWFNRESIFGSDDNETIRNPYYMILGATNVGKTFLFELLTNEGTTPLLTVTSQLPNRGIFKLPSDKASSLNIGDFEVIDYPSNPKLKNLFLIPFLKKGNKVLKNCKGIIYIVDSSTFNEEACNSVAKDIIEFLSFTERLPNGVDICVFCNKCDLFTSKRASKIKSLLEAEITKVYNINLQNLNKVDQSNENVDEEDENDQSILNAAFKGDTFNFAALEGNCDFVEGNMFKDKLSNLYDWIDERGVN